MNYEQSAKNAIIFEIAISQNIIFHLVYISGKMIFWLLSDYTIAIRLKGLHQKAPRLQQLNFDALAEEFGFGSGRSLSVAFKEITDINLRDFIRMSKLS